MYTLKVVFYRGKSPIAKLIQFISKSDFSHVGVVLDYQLIDIDYWHKYRISPFEWKSSDYESIEFMINDEQYYKALKHIFERVGSDYDSVLTIDYLLKLGLDDEDKFNCVEVVVDMLTDLGCNLPIECYMSISPQRLYNILI